jgi:hypothetical protein
MRHPDKLSFWLQIVYDGGFVVVMVISLFLCSRKESLRKFKGLMWMMFILVLLLEAAYSWITLRTEPISF